VAHGDDEAGSDEDRDLADFDHLFGVDVASGLEDDVDRLAVLLNLRPLMRPHRVLDGQLVQPELGGDRLELRRVWFDHAEPDEGARFLRRLAGSLQRETALASLSVLVGCAVDDHRPRVRPASDGPHVVIGLTDSGRPRARGSLSMHQSGERRGRAA
jgi:hypothetical protein